MAIKRFSNLVKLIAEGKGIIINTTKIKKILVSYTAEKGNLIARDIYRHSVVRYLATLMCFDLNNNNNK